MALDFSRNLILAKFSENKVLIFDHFSYFIEMLLGVKRVQSLKITLSCVAQEQTCFSVELNPLQEGTLKNR